MSILREQVVKRVSTSSNSLWRYSLVKTWKVSVDKTKKIVYNQNTLKIVHNLIANNIKAKPLIRLGLN